MQLNSIETEADHQVALLELERLWGAREGTANEDRLESLTVLVEAYEESHFPIDLPDLNEARKFRLEQMREREPGAREGTGLPLAC